MRQRELAQEVDALRPHSGPAPFDQLRDLVRTVQPDCAIDLDTNSYSVPWRLVGETVQVVVLAGRVIVRHAGALMADHPSSVASEGAVPVGQKPR